MSLEAEHKLGDETPRLAVVPTPLATPEPTLADIATVPVVPATPAPLLPFDPKPHSEFLWNVHKYSNDYIRFADTKAAFTILITSAIVGALFKDGMHQLFLNAAPKLWGPIAWMAFAAYVSLGSAIGFGVWVIRPRLSGKQSKGYLFWGGVHEHGGPDAYWSSLRAQSAEQLCEHVAHHLFVLSGVAKQKYLWVSVAMTAATLGGTLAALTLLFR